MKSVFDYFYSLKNGIGHSFLHTVIRHYLQKKEMRTWMDGSYKKSFLPTIAKQSVLKEYAAKYNLHTLIETGTFLGDTIDSCRNSFNEIISIELDEKLCEKARIRFSKYKNISILHGSSDALLPKVLSNVSVSCLFWLDAHYSGGITAKDKSDTPILSEISYVLDHSIDTHVILIDDARCFGSRKDYPTIDELKDLILKQHPSWHFELKDDIIRIHQ